MTETRRDPTEAAASLQPERVERPSVAALDAILGTPIKVLDDGFVRVVDYMGSDASIVQAARVSYGSGTKQVSDDTKLIRYLLRHHHTTPFEMCEIKLHVRVPMDTWRQWIRHRTANVNEYSTRYSVAIDAAQRTPAGEWRQQDPSLKQGSAGMLPAEAGSELSAEEARLQEDARRVYERRLAMGVAREQARKDLPLSTYTEAYWKVDLHNLLHFVRLRIDAHAQEEIRRYAEVLGHEVLARWCPAAWAAFVEYQLEATSLSRTETRMLAAMLRGERDAALDLARKAGWIAAPGEKLPVNRERKEFEAKLAEMGIAPPWHPVVATHAGPGTVMPTGSGPSSS